MRNCKRPFNESWLSYIHHAGCIGALIGWYENKIRCVLLSLNTRVLPFLKCLHTIPPNAARALHDQVRSMYLDYVDYVCVYL